MKNLAFVILVLLLCLKVLHVKADVSDRYNVSRLDLATGLPSSFVDDIYCDSNGFIWISTHGAGLLRYDGYTFTNFSFSPTFGMNLRSLSSHNAVEDKYKRLWVAFDECLQTIDLRMGLKTQVKAVSEDMQKKFDDVVNVPCLRVYCDAKGCIWITKSYEIDRIAFDENGLVNSVLKLKHNTKVPDFAINDIYGDGSVYTGANFRIGKIVVKGNRLVLQDLSKRYPQLNGIITEAIIRWKGRIWFGTDHGLYNDLPGNKGLHHDGTPNGLSHDVIEALAVEPEGEHLLVGSLGGIDIVDSNSNVTDHWNSNSPNNALSSNFVNTILVKNGHIWVGSESGGITHLYPRRLLLRNFVHDDAAPSSISAGPVNAMLSATNGDLWVGTVEGGLNYHKAGTEGFVHFTTANSGLRHNSVSTLLEDPEGTLWIGTWGGGAYYVPGAVRRDASGSDAGMKILPLSTDARHAQDFQFIGAMAYDKYNKGIWIGANAGLFFYSLKTHKVMDPFPNCRTINGAIGSLVTSDGKLLMGCVPGMVCVDLKKGMDKKGHFAYTHYLYMLSNPSSRAFEKITSFCQGRDGSLWIGSNGYGLYHVTGSLSDTTAIKNFTTADGLSNNSVKGIVEDEHGTLLIATARGLSTLNPKEGTFNVFVNDDGLISDQFYFNGAEYGGKSTVYLGSDRGLIVLYGANRKSNYPGKLTLTGLMVNNQYVVAGSKYIDEDISLAKVVHLHESDRSFTFEFSDLSYGGVAQGSYSYRMRGYEDDWIPLPPGTHSVRYTNLSPGSYSFEVRYVPSLNSSGVQMASVEVDVSPYFWRSWWFVSLLVVALIALAWFVYRRRIEKLREQEVELIYHPIEVALKESPDPQHLQSRIQDILRNQKSYLKGQEETVEEEKKTYLEQKKPDEPFMDRMMKVMKTLYSNPDLDVRTLADAMQMTRTELSKNLQQEMGETTTQFIRNYRLDIARRMLEDNVAESNITEIAYRVGFNDPKYFTRCFSKKFGVKPSSYK